MMRIRAGKDGDDVNDNHIPNVSLTNIGNGYFHVLDCHTSHIVVKFSEIVTKIDRRSGRRVSPTRAVRCGDMRQTVAVSNIKTVEKKDLSGAKVPKSAAKKSSK
ncbi:hypothetical protein MLD38_010197 [Melastoma candidum]|uniref:Uncharacterized protein n=1 Tax=Melastoma candidum TaxID=119954 RepID=A0ACB9R261_9MYRT|nr:hypothetical protein MLD38_010197 [Melastoma candidum]